MNDGTVTCILCDAIINLKMGNFYKFQLLIKNEDRPPTMCSDINQYLVMVLSFLNTEEKEVIIEKVLPRMQRVLNAGRNN